MQVHHCLVVLDLLALGHALGSRITEVYAEANVENATEIALQVG